MEGYYEFAYEGGCFEVALRPGGVFFCPTYQAQAVWLIHEGKLQVDWKQYGQYELTQSREGLWEGSSVGNAADWRKATFVRPFSPVEALLLGEGTGSEWDFAYDGGSFTVQFKGDGFNHFRCPTYPAHSHWKLLPTGNLFVDWGQYGKYDLVCDPAAKTMTGSVTGDPSQWRKATFLGNIAAAVAGAADQAAASYEKH